MRPSGRLWGEQPPSPEGWGTELYSLRAAGVGRVQGGMSQPLGPEPQGLYQGPGNLNRGRKVGVGSLGTGYEIPPSAPSAECCQTPAC